MGGRGRHSLGRGGGGGGGQAQGGGGGVRGVRTNPPPPPPTPQRVKVRAYGSTVRVPAALRGNSVCWPGMAQTMIFLQLGVLKNGKARVG